MANYRVTSNHGYWHTSIHQDPSVVWAYVDGQEIPENSYGPFPTWERARQDAVAFHKVEIVRSKSNIGLLRASSEAK
jgi:hypothetical protein